MFASAAALTIGVATVPVYEIYKAGADLAKRKAAYFAAVWSNLLELAFWDDLPDDARQALDRRGHPSTRPPPSMRR